MKAKYVILLVLVLLLATINNIYAQPAQSKSINVGPFFDLWGEINAKIGEPYTIHLHFGILATVNTTYEIHLEVYINYSLVFAEVKTIHVTQDYENDYIIIEENITTTFNKTGFYEIMGLAYGYTDPQSGFGNFGVISTYYVVASEGVDASGIDLWSGAYFMYSLHNPSYGSSAIGVIKVEIGESLGDGLFNMTLIFIENMNIEGQALPTAYEHFILNTNNREMIPQDNNSEFLGKIYFPFMINVSNLNKDYPPLIAMTVGYLSGEETVEIQGTTRLAYVFKAPPLAPSHSDIKGPIYFYYDAETGILLKVVEPDGTVTRIRSTNVANLSDNTETQPENSTNDNSTNNNSTNNEETNNSANETANNNETTTNSTTEPQTTRNLSPNIPIMTLMSASIVAIIASTLIYAIRKYR